MSCPTCDHTVHGLRGVIFWCPRCGTICDRDNGGFYERPKLVDRCRTFERESLIAGTATPAAWSLWFRLGIRESINPPGDRPEAP